MYCKKCGSEISNSTRFCKMCGQQISGKAVVKPNVKKRNILITCITVVCVLLAGIGGLHFIQNAKQVDLSVYTEADEVLQENIVSDSFRNASLDERKKIAQETLDKLENTGQIQEGSVRYSESGYYCFNFLNGAEGIIQLSNEENFVEGVPTSKLYDDSSNVTLIERIPGELLELSSPYNEADKRALIIDELDYEFNSKNFEEDKKEWDKCHLNTTIEKNFTVQQFKTDLSKYDFVSIRCHGFIDTSINTNLSVPMICTNEPFGHDIEKYILDLSSGRVGAIYSSKAGSYFIKPDFFKYYYSTKKLDNTIIWLGCCNGYKNDKLVKAFSDVGAKAVIGATESVSSYYGSCICSEFVYNLFCGIDVEASLEYAKEVWGKNDGSDALAEFKLYEDDNSDLVHLFTLTESAKAVLENTEKIKGSVSGSVVSDTGEAVENAEVTIIPEDSALTEQSSVTDSDGSYHISCDAGSYKIRVSADGYESYESEECFSVESGIDTLLDIIKLTEEKKVLTEEDLKTLILERSGDKMGVWKYEDYDGNGTKEAYAVIISGDDSLEAVYFIDSEGNITEMPADFWGGSCYIETAKYTRCNDKGFFSVDMGNYGSGWQTLLYSVKNGSPYELGISREIQGFYEENGIYYTTENEFVEAGGHLYPEVELLYDSTTQQFSKGERIKDESADNSDAFKNLLNQARQLYNSHSYTYSPDWDSTKYLYCITETNKGLCLIVNEGGGLGSTTWLYDESGNEIETSVYASPQLHYDGELYDVFCNTSGDGTRYVSMVYPETHMYLESYDYSDTGERINYSYTLDDDPISSSEFEKIYQEYGNENTVIIGYNEGILKYYHDGTYEEYSLEEANGENSLEYNAVYEKFIDHIIENRIFRSINNEVIEDYITSISYTQFDMNSDGVPELIINAGSCEADMAINFYTYKNGEVVLIGNGFSGFHSGFYKDIENGEFVTQWGQMGIGGIYWYNYDGDKVYYSKQVDQLDYATGPDSDPNIFDKYGEFEKLNYEHVFYSVSDSLWYE